MLADVMNQGIKAILESYPAVGDILADFEVGCVGCQVGTCLLKDVVTIHNLTSDQEAELWSRISAIISPGSIVTPVVPKTRTEKGSAPNAMSPAFRKMMDEHAYILRVLDQIPVLTAQLNLARDHETVTRILQFIQQYADGYHHAKEEAVLFGFFSPEEEIIKVMLNEHVQGRQLRARVQAGLERQEPAAIIEGLMAFRDLLMEHIKKEDTILYPWMDRVLDTRQVGELFAQCAAVDADYQSVAREFEAFVVSLETSIKEEIYHESH